MNGSLQNGVYYRHDHKIGNSFCILFLKFSNESNIELIGDKLASIWSRLKNVERGIIEEIDVNPSKRSSGNLSALIGYNSRVFALDGVRKQKPLIFEEKWNFIPSVKGQSSPIVNGSAISYSSDPHKDPLITDHVGIQIIADTEFHTNRALVEIWKAVYSDKTMNEGEQPIDITKYYTGFHSPTGRSLIGFHDGISNLKSKERSENIIVNRVHDPADSWIINGTFMAFIRILFNLDKWEKLGREQQEVTIGRDKKTGCPLIGVTKEGKPIKDRMCPVPGTYEVTEPGNERYREHPSYRRQNLPVGVSDRILENSHVGRTNPITSIFGRTNDNFKIFRQGYQFLQCSNFDKDFYIGLNFVSFQNTLEKLFNILTYSNSSTNFPPSSNLNKASLHDFFFVEAAGNFLVPPIHNNESFPGCAIFGIR